MFRFVDVATTECAALLAVFSCCPFCLLDLFAVSITLPVAAYKFRLKLCTQHIIHYGGHTPSPSPNHFNDFILSAQFND